MTLRIVDANYWYSHNVVLFLFCFWIFSTFMTMVISEVTALFCHDAHFLTEHVQFAGPLNSSVLS